jgi:hypothetical protein
VRARQPSLPSFDADGLGLADIAHEAAILWALVAMCSAACWPKPARPGVRPQADG